MKRIVIAVLLCAASSLVFADDIVLRGGQCQAGSWGTEDTGGRLSGVSVFSTQGVQSSSKAWQVCRANTALVQKSGCFAQKKNIVGLKSGVRGVTITLTRRAVPGGPDHYEIDNATEAQLMRVFSGRWQCP